MESDLEKRAVRRWGFGLFGIIASGLLGVFLFLPMATVSLILFFWLRTYNPIPTVFDIELNGVIGSFLVVSLFACGCAGLSLIAGKVRKKISTDEEYSPAEKAKNPIITFVGWGAYILPYITFWGLAN